MSRSEFTASANVRVGGDCHGKEDQMSKWPEPRPIEEAPDSAVLGWCPGDDECDDGWDLCYPSLLNNKWINREGDICHPTHFLPLPPKPEPL